MSNSNHQSFITQYITNFAKKSVLEYTWYYSEVYYRTVFSTIVYLKASNKYSANYLSACDKILTSNSNFLMLLALRFCRKSYESGLNDILSLTSDPMNNPLFLNMFNDVYKTLVNDLELSLGSEITERSRGHVSQIMGAVAVYCWQYLKNARERGLVAKLTEELYLLREIEAFKNRKGE